MSITRIITRHIADRDRPVSSVSLTEIPGAAHTILSLVWSGMDLDTPPETPQGVTALVLAKPADTVIRLPMRDDLWDQMIAAAWSMGAWNITGTRWAPYAGALPGDLAGDAEAIAQIGCTRWTWLSMLGGPELRAKKWARRDTTLTPILLARTGAAPDLARPLIDAGRQTVLRLGVSPEAQRPARPVPRATRAQRWTIIKLRQRLGEAGAPLPAALDIREASAIITDLQQRLT